ncbi:MAG: hypothetical protein PHP00_06035 [Thiotrichaceae bacterium]|nr:hypothetical protein [Thiotrichaceae bacterium]
MESLVIQPSATAQWHALVGEAEQACATRLGEELESYLVFLLMRYTDSPEIANSVLALDYLHSMEAVGHLRETQLREVGDKCLLYSGLFPARAERRRVNSSYYVKLGMGAYSALATALAQLKAKLFEDLSQQFVKLMDVLQTMRELGNGKPCLQPLQAMELWTETGSAHALQNLAQYTNASPVQIALISSSTLPKNKTYAH